MRDAKSECHKSSVASRGKDSRGKAREIFQILSCHDLRKIHWSTGSPDEKGVEGFRNWFDEYERIFF